MSLLRTRRAIATVGAVAVAGALPASAAAKPRITMSGSTTVAPLAALLIKKYLNVCHHCAKFTLLQGGSNVGVSDVAHGRVTIGNSSRDPQPTDPGGLVFTPVARDAVCLITNKANGLGDLSQQRAIQIFSGGVRNWSQVPGATIGGTIDLFQRAATSGTHDAFQKLVMTSGGKSTNVSSLAKPQSSNGLVEQAVKGDRNAIGYVSLHFSGGVHAVSYQGVACRLREAKSGQYPAVRNLYMVTRGNAGGAAGRFIRWVTHSGGANRIVAGGWVPLR